MDLGRLAGIGIWAVKRGGLSAVDDVAALALMYHGLPDRPTLHDIKVALTPERIQAAARVGKLIVGGILDPTEGPTIEAEIKALGT